MIKETKRVREGLFDLLLSLIVPGILFACGTVDIANLSEEDFIKEANPCADVTGVFADDVVPVFSRNNCTNSGCHAATDPGGGLSLVGEPTDILTALTSEDRVSVSTPEDSLLFRKALGEVAHNGGQQLSETDEDYTTLLCWIRAGAQEDF